MQLADNHVKGCSDSTGVREIEIKVAMRYYSLCITTNMEIKYCCGDRGQVCSPTASGSENCSFFGKQSGNNDQK